MCVWSQPALRHDAEGIHTRLREELNIIKTLYIYTKELVCVVNGSIMTAKREWEKFVNSTSIKGLISRICIYFRLCMCAWCMYMYGLYQYAVAGARGHSVS